MVEQKFIITAAHVVDGGEVWIKDGLDVVKSETLWVDKESRYSYNKADGRAIYDKACKISRLIWTIIRLAP
jgi:hypothetical protein